MEESKDRTRIKNRNRDEDTAEHMEGVPLLGNIIWVNLHGDLWWPAVVVDENAVSESNKPDVRIMGDALVRLYGSYEYLFVDPNKLRTEFETILEQNNGCYREIFMKALEQDLHCSISSRSKKRRSKSRDVAEPSSRASKQGEVKRKLKSDSAQFSHGTGDYKKIRTPRKDTAQKKKRLETPSSGATSAGRNQTLSARRQKVMQTLGLAAPLGSPFE